MTKSSYKDLILGSILTILAYVFFASSSGMVRALPSHFSVFQVVFFQHFIGFLFIMSYTLKKGVFSFKSNFKRMHLIRDILAVASFVLYYFGIQKIALVDATTLTYTSPFFTPFVWKLLKKEKLEKDVWWAIIIGFFGVLMILKPGFKTFNIGIVASISSAVVTSISLVLIRMLNQKKEASHRILLYYFAISSIVMLPFVVFDYSHPTIIEWLLLLGIGISTFFGQYLLTQAYKFGTPSFLSPLCYSMVIFVMFISWLIFKNPPDILSIAGSFIVITGGTFTFILRKKSHKFINIVKR